MMSLGLRTLFSKEVRRYMRVSGQTLLSPVITTVLYFVVFGYSLGQRLQQVDGIPYARYIVPGLVALGVISNAFLNSASSIFIMKMQGTMVDLLVTPLSYGEILTGFVGAAVLRGLKVGLLMWLVSAVFTGFGVAHPVLAIAQLTLVATAFATLGFVVSIWADKFEQVNFVPTFIITPLTFLGGVFYALEMLPPALQMVTRWNPIFYIVDGLRYAMLGVNDGPLLLGWIVVGVLNAAALGLAYWMLRTGYKLRG